MSQIHSVFASIFFSAHSNLHVFIHILCQQGDLICYQRKNGGDPLPGCEGTPNSGTDFCIKPEYTYQPTPRPTRRPTPRPTRRPTRYREFYENAFLLS